MAASNLEQRVKYKVKAGKEFQLDAEVVVHIEVNVHTNASKSKKESFSWKKALTIVLVAIVFSSVLASTTYGVVTGDFSMLKDLATIGGKAIAAGLENATSSSIK